ncbi:MAG: RNA polymerase sigma factor [Acidimicrobiia bacterium]
MSADAWARRIRDALWAACHPGDPGRASVGAMAISGALSPWYLTGAISADRGTGSPTATGAVTPIDAQRLVVDLFEREGQSLVRLARIFVDDRNAAEDIVQEAFIRLARAAHRIKDESKAAPYLRSIVLNLARDNNRRGLVSLRHHLPTDDRRASTEDEIELREDQQQVIDALRDLPHRQRNALVLRYYEELGIDDIALAMGISRNSVKTHLRRGLAALEERLGDAMEPVGQPIVDPMPTT